MTDSIDRKPEDNTKEAILERLHNANITPPNKKEEVTDLPGWVKVALVYKQLYDLPYKDTLETLRIKRAPRTLGAYAHSPAAKKLIAGLEEFKEDPVAMAKAILRGNALNVMLDRVVALEQAKAAGDYSEVDKIARDMQDRIPELAKKSGRHEGTGGIVQIVFDGGSLQPVRVQTEHKQLSGDSEADWEVVNDE